MAQSRTIQHYMEKPERLMDMIGKVIKNHSHNRLSDIPDEKVVQYTEVSKTIDRLKDAGTAIPDELRRLKLELAHEAEQKKEADDDCRKALLVLQMMEGRLSHFLTDIRAAIAKLSDKPAAKGRQKRYVKRTSPTVLVRELKKAIRELGGAAKKADVLQHIKRNMSDRFKPQDLERDARGNLNWEKWVVAEKARLTREGVLKAGSGFGIWELRRK